MQRRVPRVHASTHVLARLLRQPRQPDLALVGRAAVALVGAAAQLVADHRGVGAVSASGDERTPVARKLLLTDEPQLLALAADAS